MALRLLISSGEHLDLKQKIGSRKDYRVPSMGLTISRLRLMVLILTLSSLRQVCSGLAAEVLGSHYNRQPSGVYRHDQKTPSAFQ